MAEIIYRVVGTLDRKGMRFDVCNWEVLKETEQTVLLQAFGYSETRRRIGKGNLNLVFPSVSNDVESLISFSAWVIEESKIKSIKEQILEKIEKALKTYEEAVEDRKQTFEAYKANIK